MKKDTIEYNGLVGGAIILVGLIAYFLIMQAFGLAHNVELRVFNIVFIIAGVFYAIKFLKKRNKNFDYLKGLGAGFLAAASSSLAFATFIIIYLSIIQQDFLNKVEVNEAFGEYLSPFMVGVVTLTEGIFWGIIVTFAFMQWFKKQLTSDEFLKKEVDSSKK
ncbi:hypothetical protein JKA74_17955 [Marivirga sp. S37H4]|uniref:DUF4199 domain-containing protein n=1 Tax=Marivirga aurantiaca TaxID=2802615 RepID=A0A934X0Y2_9BACT|nr:hypothetical protein [Marivirga aurantiaca]MBK6266933.1 hypothetical protein [Marivirga aurantiaca]